jgi:hypothetical protein
MSTDKIEMTDNGVKALVNDFDVFLTGTDPKDPASLGTEQATLKEHTPLKPGSSPKDTPFLPATTLAQKFEDYFGGIDTALTGMQTDLGHIKSALVNAHLKLNNAEDETFTEAQMMTILNANQILTGVTPGAPPPPSSH